MIFMRHLAYTILIIITICLIGILAYIFWPQSISLNKIHNSPLELLSKLSHQELPQQKNKFLINVFASWCISCQVEHPLLMKLKAQGYRIIGLSFMDTPEKSQTMLKKMGNPYALILNDPKGIMAVHLAVQGLPQTSIWTKEQKIWGIDAPLQDHHINEINHALPLP